MTTISKKKNSSPEINTFGCRLNIWESQVISDHASNHGHSDLVIFNTCAVTSEAERQARQSIRSAKKNRPNAKILVTGCAAQIDPQKWSNMPEVNFVIGNKEKLEEKFWNYRKLAQLKELVKKFLLLGIPFTQLKRLKHLQRLQICCMNLIKF